MESLYHDDDDIVKIFLPGQRGKQATENGFKGSGLGLYIIQTLLSICNIGIKFVRMPNTKITIDKNLKYSSNIFVITIPNN
jgi:signal transduction histidine kinase